MTKHEETGRRFVQLSDEILRTLWSMNPVEATILGVHDYDTTLGNISRDAVSAYAATLRKCVTALQSEVDSTLLDPDDELNYHIALSLASSSLIMLERQRPWMHNPSTYPSICIWGCFSLLVRDCADGAENARMILSRVREIPEFLETSKQNIEHPARLFVDHALEMVQGAQWFFQGPFAEIAAGAGDIQGELLSARDRAVAALDAYGRWLAEGVLPNADGDFAVGGDVYGQLLFDEQQLTYTPRELVEIAEGVLRDTESEITEIAARIDPSVSWQDLIARLKDEYPPEDGVIEAYRESFESARAFVIERDLVTLADGECLDISETPPFERAIVPYAG